MRLAFLLVFVAFPLLELALLIKTGQSWGFWPVFGVIVGTGLLGTAILRRQGFRVAEKVAAELNAGRAPIAPLADSGLIFAAGALLLSPGLIGDTLGVLLMVPGVRSLVGAWLSARLLGNATVVVSTSSMRTTHRDGEPRHSPPVIEGDWERLDDDPPR
jgi:UPF0716 protein FxsA